MDPELHSGGPVAPPRTASVTSVSGPRRLLWALADSFAIAAGVAAVVLAVATSQAAYTLSRGPAYGLDRQVVVVSGTADSSSGIEAGLSTSSLTPSDVSALENPGLVFHAVSVAPTVGARTELNAQSRSTSTDLIGSTESFSNVLGYSVLRGRFISSDDVATSASVVVLGQTVVNSLFGGTNPVGRSVVVDSTTLQVVGTFAPKGYLGSYDQDNLAVIPITTAWKAVTGLSTSQIDQVLIRTSSPASAVAVAREATGVIMGRHDIVDPGLSDFSVHRLSDLLTAQLQAAGAVRRVLEAAAIALLLAGAIQVATATRLRLVTTGRAPSSGEAGTERFVGALSVGLMGGLLGVVGGYLLAPAIHHLAAEVPGAHVTIHGVVAGAAIGVVASAVGVLPDVLRRRQPGHPVHREEQPQVPVG